jgi:hypothetical protein
MTRRIEKKVMSNSDKKNKKTVNERQEVNKTEQTKKKKHID